MQDRVEEATRTALLDSSQWFNVRNNNFLMLFFHRRFCTSKENQVQYLFGLVKLQILKPSVIPEL